jgi:rhamnogalacturonyl hydrolase YesR
MSGGKAFWSLLLAASAALASLPLHAQPAPPAVAVPPRPDLSFAADTLPDPERVRAVLDYAAAAQIASLQAQPVTLTGGQVRQITSNWVSAAFLVGLARLTRVSGRPEQLAFLSDVASHYNYALRGGHTPRAMINADDQAIGDLYQELYARRRMPGLIMPLQQRLDYTLPHLTVTPAPEKLVWWWCDALFMAPPVLARMSALTGDPAYLDAMDVQWWRTTDLLFDKSEGLYFRDERFLDRKSERGRKIFWSRGNGWVFAGLARVLDYMPADHPTRPRYVALFRQMAKSIAALQHADGLWRASMVDPEAFPEPESSGSAFFTYGFAWGINHGLLDRAAYQPRVLRGWAGLMGRVLPSGLLGSVQQTGDQPVPTRDTDTGLYGSGGLLLAGIEIMKLGEAASPLPIAEVTGDARDQAAPPLPSGPVPQTEQEKREAARRVAEREATRVLAYDPLLHGSAAAPMPAGRPLARWAVPPVGTAAVKPIAPPSDAERQLRATVRFAPERDDDIWWENDRTAHRAYGPALEKREPPSSSGIDAWAKRVRHPFMKRQLATGSYHDDHGEGMDYYDVRGSRGVGGLGIWADNKLWVSRNFKTYRILQDGPSVARFELDYAPWPVGVDRRVWETRSFSLALGGNFTRMVSTIGSDSAEPLIVAIGLGKRGTSATQLAAFTADRARGRFSVWDTGNLEKGAMGAAIAVDPAMIVDVVQDADNYLVLLRVTPGKPFVYHAGATWARGLDFKTREQWEAHVKSVALSFDPAAR